VISGKSLNLFSFFAASAVLFFALPAIAQDAGYAPPPMFEDMTPPMVRPEGQDGYLVTPKSSSNTPLPEPQRDGVARQTPVITPRVSVDPNSPGLAPAQAPVAPPSGIVTPPQPPVESVTPATVVPPQQPTMMQPIIEEKPAVTKITPKPKAPPVPIKKPIVSKAPVETPVQPIKPESPAQPVPPPKVQEKPVVQDLTAPIVPRQEVEAPVIPPVPRDPSQSAIKGPKTMPALPTEKVDEQVLFEGKSSSSGQTILERHQKSIELQKEATDVKSVPSTPDAKTDQTLMPVVPLPNPNVTPAAFDPGDQGILKKSIPFQPGQIGLPAPDADPIVAGVVKEIEGKDDWRIQIRAFATPHGNGLSSDRRIALSRALSLRSTMIAQGVPASRVDVMAEGLQSDPSKPGDRIDLYLYGPKAQ